jgi:hypothetical protein
MPFATIPENILQRYLGVKALAEKGTTEGERNAARNVMRALEAKHPTILIESELYDQMQRGEGPSVEEPPPPPRATSGATSDPNFGPYTASSGNWGGSERKPQPGQPGRWGNVMDLLGQAWDVAKEVTEGAVNAEAGRLYADQSVAIESSQTAAGNMRYVAAAPVQMLMAAKYRFNDVQKQAFAKRVGERVAERVYAFLVAP